MTDPMAETWTIESTDVGRLIEEHPGRLRWVERRGRLGATEYIERILQQQFAVIDHTNKAVTTEWRDVPVEKEEQA